MTWMRFVKPLLLTVLLGMPLSSVSEDGFSYAEVAKRYPATRLDAEAVEEFEMHGECLVGLKQLIFVKRDHFDPVAEWINYRTFSLLEQYPPCHVLIMMQVARSELMDGEAAQ